MHVHQPREHVGTRPDGTELAVVQKYSDDRMQQHIERTLGSYRPPLGDQAPRYEMITRSAFNFAQVLVDFCPPSAELTLALRHVEDARMRANQSIAINETHSAA